MGGLKLIALKGTSLTLLGLFELDIESGTTKMTELTHILTGGVQEAISRV